MNYWPGAPVRHRLGGGMSKLAAALFTRTQQQVLALLYGRPDRSFYTKEILRATRMGVHTIMRELGRMVEAGILTTHRQGNQKHFQANPACPIYAELVSIVKKTVGVADMLRAALQPLAGDIDVAFVYGSIATGEETAKSDIDLMLVATNISYAELMEALAPAQEQLRRPINPTVYTQAEIRKKLQDQNNFLQQVLAGEKIPLFGADKLKDFH